ncbi:hypothetical protein Ahy_A10g050746 [Arachis hypogaea]|uniref:KIB1-4 beta-propeller domain-containing protein n=1 Tax=Arachis hypogaea TaxID=3818 RepID=A0A445BAC9_ARAHY|nr:hypothetical protein Ahy_A10g050746 [Arachis hypogaea]
MAEIDRWWNLHPDLVYEITEHLYSYHDYIRLRLLWMVDYYCDIRAIFEGAIRMLNPFTKSHIDLPPISTFLYVLRYHPDRHGDEYVRLALRDDLIYTLDAISFHKHEMFQDVIFFQDKIYAADYHTYLYEFDKKVIMDKLGKKPRPQLVPLLSSIGGICEAPPPTKLAMYLNFSMNKYVIGCVDGSLLMIVKHDSEAMKMLHMCNKFDVFKLNKNSKEWSRIHNLEDYTVMIGYNSSIQMFPGNSPYCKENQIYYRDNQVELHTPGC